MVEHCHIVPPIGECYMHNMASGNPDYLPCDNKLKGWSHHDYAMVTLSHKNIDLFRPSLCPIHMQTPFNITS